MGFGALLSSPGGISPSRLSRLFIYLSLLLALPVLSRELHNLAYPLVTSLFVLLAFFMDGAERYPISNRVITVATLGVVLLHLRGLGQENLFQRMAQVMMVLVVAKLVSKKGPRDYLQLALFSLIFITAASVGEWGMAFGVLLVVHSLLLVMGVLFLYASTEVNRLTVVEASGLARWGLLVGTLLLPVSLFLFFALPRPQVGFTPGWIGGRRVARSGFGDTVTPASVESIKRDTSVAFRVELPDGAGPMPPSRLYWRGRVYGNYHQGGWSFLEGEHEFLRSFIPVSGKRIRYRVFLEPYTGRALFTLGLPLKVKTSRGRARWVEGYTLAMGAPVDRRLSYSVVSLLLPAIPADSSPSQFLSVPPGTRGALKGLLSSLPLGRGGSLELARRVVAYLRRNHRYTLNPPPYSGKRPVVDFLLKKGPGHCEYFASAMALLLRLRGVPTRLVAGFVGGEWNPVGHYYLVRNSDAHTWVEVWDQGLGWVPFDPTPTVAVPEELPGRLQMVLDYLRFQWYHWIINYDYQRQVGLLEKGISLLSGAGGFSVPHARGPSRATLLRVAAVSVGLLVLLFFFRVWMNRPKGWGERIERVLMARGTTRQPGETLLEVAERLEDENRELAIMLREAVLLYYKVEFGGGGDEERLAELLGRLKR